MSDEPGFAGLLDNLRIDGSTKARITITRIRKIQIAAMETAKIGELNLVMICPFCEARWESPDGADEERYVMCSECSKHSKQQLKQEMEKNGLEDNRLYFHA